MMRTLRDMNMSKFVAEDVPLFMSLIDDMFPGLRAERAAFPEVAAALEKVRGPALCGPVGQGARGTRCRRKVLARSRAYFIFRHLQRGTRKPQAFNGRGLGVQCNKAAAQPHVPWPGHPPFLAGGQGARPAGAPLLDAQGHGAVRDHAGEARRPCRLCKRCVAVRSACVVCSAP